MTSQLDCDRPKTFREIELIMSGKVLCDVCKHLAHMIIINIKNKERTILVVNKLTTVNDTRYGRIFQREYTPKSESVSNALTTYI